MPGNTDGFGNPLPRRSASADPGNSLPIDLYRRLLPRIQEEDQAAGAHGYTFRFDDPSSKWDSGDPTEAWDAVGLSPVIQELFYVIERMEGEDVEVLESLDALVDPLRCPEEFLPRIAASFGYALQGDLGEAEGISSEMKRSALLGLIDAYRARGTFIGFKVFYRLIGLEIIEVFELWKKNIQEADQDYSRVRFVGPTPPAGPGTAPSVVAVAGGAVTVGAHQWVVSFVDSTNTESPLGPASVALAIVAPDQTVNLALVPLGPIGTTARRIYRTKAAGPAGVFFLVGQIVDNVTTVFVDALSDAVLGTPAPVGTATTAFIGPAGVASFAGTIPDSPIIPGSMRVTADTGSGPIIIRDDPGGIVDEDVVRGTLIGPGGESGAINYRTGEFTLALLAPAVSPVTAQFTRIAEEWPYRAARIDVDILLSPGGAPIPLVDAENLSTILTRMEETRPIHVLLRAIALVAEVQDTFGEDGASGATDRTGCIQHVRDERTGQPFPGDPGRDYNYLLDMAVSAGDEFVVEQVAGGVTTEHDQVFDDEAQIVCPLDTLVINDGSTDQYW